MFLLLITCDSLQEYSIKLDSLELESALRFLARVGIILHFECTRAGLNELYFIGLDYSVYISIVSYCC